MVDFQKRDTRRGLDSRREESPAEEAESGDDTDDALGIVVVTVSAGTVEAGAGGSAAAEAARAAGHTVATRELTRVDADAVHRTIGTETRRAEVDLVVTCGGTAVRIEAAVVEAAERLFEQSLPGFGELFRRRLAAEIGTGAITDRATAGVAGGVPVACLPAGETAATIGVEEILLPEAEEIVAAAGSNRTETAE